MHIDPAAILNWLTNHYSFAGWFFVAGLLWKVARFATRLEAKFSEGFKNLDKLTNNEMSHIQTSLESLSDSFKDMRDDIRELMLHHYKK